MGDAGRKRRRLFALGLATPLLLAPTAAPGTRAFVAVGLLGLLAVMAGFWIGTSLVGTRA